MDTQQPPRRLPNIRVRVLIIGRANAGKTSILQRVCDTTQSPVIYRRTRSGWYSDEQIQLDPSTERGEHSIEDELVFSNHDGYIFHDSRGFESGDNNELEIVQKFVREKSGKKRLRDRLHAIWYCVPMDNQRPELDLKHFKDICPDQNVPIIGVFTKYDQFRRNIKMHLQDHQNENLGGNPADEADRRFEEDYLHPLGEGARFVRVEKMHKANARCDELVEKTAEALNHDVVTLMLLAVQRSNLELSVKLAVKRVHPYIGDDAKDMEEIVKICLAPFPYMWYPYDLYDDLYPLDPDDLDLHPDYHPLYNDLYPPYPAAMTKHIMSLSIIKKVSTASNLRHHLVIAIITLLKHATALCASSDLLPTAALAQAELDYQKSDIDFQVASNFTGPSQQYPVQQFVDFLMGAHLSPTDIQSSVRQAESG